MIRDITIGQYYPAESVIHRLDPRVKLVGTLTFIISLFLHRSFLMYLVAAVFLTIVIKASKVPFRFMIKGLKAIMVLLLITVVFNMFLTPGTPLIRIWKLTLTVEGVKQAAFMAIRLAFLIVGSSVMTLTTTPNHLTDGMEKGLVRMAEADVKNISLSDFDTIVQVAADTGYIKQEDVKRLLAFRNDPQDESWIRG